MGNSNFIPASNVSEKFTDDEYLSDFLTENCFYRQMVEDLKKCNVDLVSEDPLETIYNCICHLNNLFRGETLQRKGKRRRVKSNYSRNISEIKNQPTNSLKISWLFCRDITCSLVREERDLIILSLPI